ncbi:MAG: protein kinase, partial [Candidatus Obscuribacterales bacterium]|nr:protein kinase [Candidatus Obscuribacterales bacterium]
FMVMEFIEGKSLSQLIVKGKPLTLSRAYALLLQICAAMEHAHNKGVLHRDIKPSNMMLIVDDKGKEQIKVVDFGLAKLLTDAEQNLTRTGAAIGTPAYIAPEAANGASIDDRCDIYSFGCMMFEMFTSLKPYAADSVLATMLLHTKGEIPCLSDKSNELFSKELEDIVRKCLEKRPVDRFATFSDLKDALQRSLAPANPDKQIENSPLPESKRSKIAWMIVAPAVTLALITGLAVSYVTLYGSDSDKHKNLKKTFIPISEISIVAGLPSEYEETPFKSKQNFTLGKKDGKQIVKADQTVRDKHLKAAAKKYAKISQWSLKDTSIDGSGLTNLIGLKIRFLDLSKTKIDASALKLVRKIDSIEELCISNCPRLVSQDIAILYSLPTLSTIKLSGDHINGDVCAALTRLKHLEFVDLDCASVTGEELNNLSMLKQLKRLKLRTDHLSEETGVSLARLPYLTDLNISGCKIDDSCASAISKSKSTVHLYLGRATISSEAVVQLAKMKLMILDLRGLQLSRKTLEDLKLLPRDCQIKYSEDQTALPAI